MVTDPPKLCLNFYYLLIWMSKMDSVHVATGDGATVELGGNWFHRLAASGKAERSQVLFYRYGHELVDDSVKHGDLGLGAPLSKGVPLESVQHPGDTGLPTEILVHEAGTAPLDHIQGINVLLEVRVPH